MHNALSTAGKALQENHGPCGSDYGSEHPFSYLSSEKAIVRSLSDRDPRNLRPSPYLRGIYATALDGFASGQAPVAYRYGMTVICT